MAGRLLRLPRLLGAAIGVPSGWLAADEEARKGAWIALAVSPRIARTAWAAAATAADYKWSLHGIAKGTAERDAALAGCHERGAERVAGACERNGGVYIKLGQHVAQLDHLLPEAYVAMMRARMLDRCPQSAFGEVRATLQEDLGKPPEEVFARLEEKPFASASLGQVHAGESPEGRKVAVKVQHRGLRETAKADVAAVSAIVRAVRWLGVDYRWLVDEMRHNLPLELDFANEGANAEECRQFFGSLRNWLARQVVIPKIEWQLTSSRVLTMEYVDGVPASDRAALERLGISSRSAASLVSSAFAVLMFRRGVVHADPHQANIFIRPGADAKHPELVILDHGLYRDCRALRAGWARLWVALAEADREGLKVASEELGAGELYQLFVSMVTTRTWERVTQGGTNHLHNVRGAASEEERAEAQHMAAERAKEIQDLLASLPRPLLLLLKTNDCLRSVDNSLGTPEVSSLALAREAARCRWRDSRGVGPIGCLKLLLSEARLLVSSLLLTLSASLA